VTGEEATVLLQLQSIWDERYAVNLNGNGTWSARRQGITNRVITAESGPLLRYKISEDYAAWVAETRRRNRG
jgi:hypothetical protein